MDEIAALTGVRIAVVNSPQSHSLAPPDSVAADSSWTGLETERVCDLAITGSSVDSVDIAKVRLLVMLDELVRSAFIRMLCAVVSLYIRVACTQRLWKLTINCML